MFFEAGVMIHSGVFLWQELPLKHLEWAQNVRWTSALRGPEWTGDAAARCRRQRSKGIGGARGPVDLGFAPTGTEWRLPQQAENRFRVTKALLAEE